MHLRLLRDSPVRHGPVTTAWAFVRLHRGPSFWTALLAGTTAGVACLTRITALSFVLPALVVVVAPVLGSAGSRMRFDTLLSEEGGRFYNALTRYQIVEVGEDVPLETPPNFRWMTTRQLVDLLRHGHDTPCAAATSSTARPASTP